MSTIHQHKITCRVLPGGGPLFRGGAGRDERGREADTRATITPRGLSLYHLRHRLYVMRRFLRVRFTRQSSEKWTLCGAGWGTAMLRTRGSLQYRGHSCVSRPDEERAMSVFVEC